MFITAAILLGLVGSFHCVGMCGPIALALPISHSGWLQKVLGTLLYNIGRAITYAAMGAVFGVLGEGIQLGGFQSWVSIAMGVIMVLSVLFPVLFRNRSLFSLFVIGLLNGLLPCGLVYVALAGAIATGGVTNGALFMFLFGLGTLPMLAAVTLLGNALSGPFKTAINKLVPYVVVIIGVLFILRGLNLGIPYISPPAKKLHIEQKHDSTESRSCCGSSKKMTIQFPDLF